MGYYIDFFLTTNDLDVDDETFINELNEVTGYDWYSELSLGEAKWYNWQEDMVKISRNHPNTFFVLEGDGEEKGDQWKAYIKNGKMQVCEAIITFEPFDESKMK